MRGRALRSIVIEALVKETDKVCKNCKYYEPHYVKWDMEEPNTFFETTWGHCIRRRCHSRKVTATCEQFEKREGVRMAAIIEDKQMIIE